MKKSLFTKLAGAAILASSLIPFRGDFSPREGSSPNYTNKIIAAHRAGNEYAQENSLESLKHLRHNDIEYVELDIQETKDNHYVIYHDARLKSDSISNLTLHEVKERGRQSGYTIPTLSESLSELKSQGKGIIADVKKGNLKKIYSIIHDYLPENQIIMSSEDAQKLRDLKETYPEVKSTLVMGSGLGSLHQDIRRKIGLVPWRNVKEANSDYISVKNANESFYDSAQKGNVGLLVWGVNNPNNIKRALKHKNTLGVITDKPSIAEKIKANPNLESKVQSILWLSLSFVIFSFMLSAKLTGNVILNENFSTGSFIVTLFLFLLLLLKVIRFNN